MVLLTLLPHSERVEEHPAGRGNIVYRAIKRRLVRL
jgi:hypothetical protein